MILFEFNDVFAQFSATVKAKFGKLPSEMTKAEYDNAMNLVLRTDFYKTMPQEQKGISLLQWAKTYRDKQAAFLLINEVKSPSWVNSEKINYIDSFCTALGIPILDFSICKTAAELKGHAYRGPLITRNNDHRIIWDSAGKYYSVYLEEEDDAMTLYNIEQSFKRFAMSQQ